MMWRIKSFWFRMFRRGPISQIDSYVDGTVYINDEMGQGRSYRIRRGSIISKPLTEEQIREAMATLPEELRLL